MKVVNILEQIEQIKPKCGNVIFISIDGHGGSGKSTFAKLLSEKLNAEIIHTDDFASWDNPLHWWELVIEKVFVPISNGDSTLNYERSKWWENHHPEPVVNQPVTKIMILEGVSSLRKEFRDYISFGIFVETPISICLQRGVTRDKDNGKSEQEIIKMWQSWLDEENKYIDRDEPQKYTDLILDGTKPFEEQVSL